VKPDDIIIIATDRMSVTAQNCEAAYFARVQIRSPLLDNYNLCPLCKTLLPAEVCNELRAWGFHHSYYSIPIECRNKHKASITEVHKELTDRFLRKYQISHKYHVGDCVIHELRLLLRDMNYPWS